MHKELEHPWIPCVAEGGLRVFDGRREGACAAAWGPAVTD